MISKALLSSKDMCWCTPKDFFQKLDKEFHFTLDAAATVRSAKCKNFFTPEIDGLAQNWNVGGGVLQPSIRETDRKMDPKSIRRIAPVHAPDRDADPSAHGYQLFPRLHIRGRLKFTDESGQEKDAAPFPSMVVIWRGKRQEDKKDEGHEREISDEKRKRA